MTENTRQGTDPLPADVREYLEWLVGTRPGVAALLAKYPKPQPDPTTFHQHAETLRLRALDILEAELTERMRYRIADRPRFIADDIDGA